MTQAGTKPLWRNVLFNAIVLVLLSMWLWQQNQPVNLIKPSMPADEKLQCVSYAPYYGKDRRHSSSPATLAKPKLMQT